MPSLMMDFLHGVAGLAEGAARLPVQFSENFSNEFANLGNKAAGGKDKTIQQNMGGSAPLNSTLNFSQATGTNRQLASDVAQVGVYAAGGEIAGAAGGVVPEVGGAVISGLAKGAVEGAAVGGAQGAAQGVGTAKNAKDLGMDFLQGAGEGAAIGGVVGGAIPAVKSAIDHNTPLNANQAGALNNPIPKPSDQFSQDDLQKMAESGDPKAIEKQLAPVTGPVVAQEIAPSVAKSTDPNVTANIIDNSVNNKIAPANIPGNYLDTKAKEAAAAPVAPEVNPQSPAPAPLPPPTPTSDINTPQQVAEQSSAAEAAYNPQQVSPEEQSLTQTGEQLSPRDNNPEPFLNAPGEAPVKSTVGKAGVMSEMGDMINSGQYSKDEVLNHYFESVPNAAPGEAQTAFNQVANSEGVNKGKINASKNPMTGKVSLAPVKLGDDMAAKANGEYAGEKIGEVGAPAYKDMKAMDMNDREQTRYLKGKSPEQINDLVNSDSVHDKGLFQQYVAHSKQYLDTAQAMASDQGQPMAYNVAYGGRTPYEPPEGFPENSPGTPNAANPMNAAETKQRIFNTHEEALGAGYTPVNEDPLVDLRNDINKRADSQAQLALANGLEQAHPGQVQMLNEGPRTAGYNQVLIPGGKNIALPADIANEINRRVMAEPPRTTLGEYYNTINGAGKEAELGGGTFHGFNTFTTFVGQQLGSLKALTDPGALGKTVANFFSESHTQQYLKDAADPSISPSGGIDTNHSLLDMASALRANIKKTSSDLDNPGDKTLAGKIVGLPGLKQVHAAVFDREIPTMILETLRQKTQGLDVFGNADDRAAGMKIAAQINKEFGVVDHDYAGLTPKQFNIAGKFLLAPGYQEGVLSTLKDAITKGGPEGKLAREAVFGKALVMGGISTLGAVAGGDFKGQTPKQVALAIMNKAINPSFDIGGYKVSTPATNISDIAKPIEQTIAGVKQGKGVFTGAGNFANSHLAFVPSKAEELGTNKSYNGNAIYGKDYLGRPVSGKTTAENIASGVLPIPAAQALQTAAGGQSIGAAIANTVGLNTSPEYNINYAPAAGQYYVQQLEATPGTSKAKIQSTSEFFDLIGQAESGKAKTKAITQAAAAIKAGDTQKAGQVIADYNQKLAKTLIPWERDGGKQYLDNTMLQLLRTATITYGSANKQANYLTKINPTSIGLPVEALQSQPQSVT